MKLKYIPKTTLKILTLVTLLSLIACDQNSSPLAVNENVDEVTSFEKSKKISKNRDKQLKDIDLGRDRFKGDHQRWHGSKEYSYEDTLNGYSGGTIQIEHGSNFHVYENSLTPPDYINWGEKVKITMYVEYDEVLNELVFTFGPSGSQFSPAAQIKLDYSLIARGDDVPNLYYIDNTGDYIEQPPTKVSAGKKFMYLDVEHFSRYAVCYGR